MDGLYYTFGHLPSMTKLLKGLDFLSFPFLNVRGKCGPRLLLLLRVYLGNWERNHPLASIDESPVRNLSRGQDPR